MAVIDITDDPRIDMAMARSIGNILTSVGQAEQNRQRRYRMDQILSDIKSGIDPETALQSGNKLEAPQDKGLMGVWQGAGRILGGRPRDITDAMIEDSLITNLRDYQRQQALNRDPLYQANVEGRNISNTGLQQDINQDAERFPTIVEGDKLRNTGMRQNIEQDAQRFPTIIEGDKLRNEGVRQNIEQNKIMNPLEVQQAQQGIEAQKLQMGWAAEDATRAAENFANQQTLFKQQQEGRIADEYYENEKRRLDLEGDELNNKYLEAQIGYELSDAKSAKSMISLQDQLNRQQENMSPAVLQEFETLADSQGLQINKVDVTNYPPGIKTEADGRKYRESNGKKYYIKPKYAYQVSRKAEGPAAQTPKEGEVALQDETGRVVATMPDLPDRTYVEVDGKTYTIPNNQLNDFRAAYPKANVYQIVNK